MRLVLGEQDYSRELYNMYVDWKSSTSYWESFGTKMSIFGS